MRKDRNCYGARSIGKGLRQARTIDIDILLFGELIEKSKDLTIPHAELVNRPFALIPLLEIDSDLMHPATKKPLNSYLNEQDQSKVVLYQDHVSRNFTS